MTSSTTARPRRIRAKAYVAATAVGLFTIVGAGVAHADTGSTSSTPTTSTSSTTNADATESCFGHDGTWPSSVVGEPAGLSAGDRGGVYLWHDASGWHLAVTHHNDHLQVYTGTISTPGYIVGVDKVRNEQADKVVVGPDHHAITFRFTNFGGIDGFDFHTLCAPRLAVDLRGDGVELPTGRVYLGHDGVSPTSVPFVIQRAR